MRSAKGALLALLTLVGALVTSLACAYVEQRARPPGGSLMMTNAADAGLVHTALAGAPLSMVVVLEATIWLAPLLIALLGFDTISGELQHHTIRFWATRTRRSSYFSAKLLGLWGLVGVLTLGLDLIAGAVVLANGFATPRQLLAVGLRCWVVAWIIAGAWAAIATFVSACFRTPILALLTTFAAFFVLWLCGVGSTLSRTAPGVGEGAGTGAVWPPWCAYLYPNSYDSLLLSADASRVAEGVGVILGFVLLVAIAGSVLLRWRDV
jgi:hypothetical protein